MFNTLFSQKSVYTVLIFSVLIVGSSLLYSWKLKRTTDLELAEPATSLQQHGKEKEVQTIQELSISTNTENRLESQNSIEANEIETTSAKTEALLDETILDKEYLTLPTDRVPTEQSDQNVPVSPFGFGTYPKVPADFPDDLQPIWTMSEEEKERLSGRQKDFELMSRVLIKLWNQGDRDFIGVLRRDKDGKVYPTYPNTMYVTEWYETETKHGIIRYPAACFGSAPGMPPIFPYVMEHGHAPEGIKFIDYKNRGYDPYEFLGL